MRSAAILVTETKRYLLSCGVLLLPILAWNAAFAPALPGAWSTTEFWREIQPALALAENGSRLIVVALPFLMPLKWNSLGQRLALALFGAGAILYFASWLAILLAPHSHWSTSAWGFLAPAYTPLLWLAGLALLGQRLFWGTWYRWWIYLIPAGVFLASHIGHLALIYVRIQGVNL